LFNLRQQDICLNEEFRPAEKQNKFALFGGFTFVFKLFSENESFRKEFFYCSWYFKEVKKVATKKFWKEKETVEKLRER
jgi:hypothetical protein